MLMPWSCLGRFMSYRKLIRNVFTTQVTVDPSSRQASQIQFTIIDCHFVFLSFVRTLPSIRSWVMRGW